MHFDVRGCPVVREVHVESTSPTTGQPRILAYSFLATININTQRPERYRQLESASVPERLFAQTVYDSITILVGEWKGKDLENVAAIKSFDDLAVRALRGHGLVKRQHGTIL